jgi:hypothetical protein
LAGVATFAETACEAILKKWPKSLPVDQAWWEKVEANGAKACQKELN